MSNLRSDISFSWRRGEDISYGRRYPTRGRNVSCMAIAITWAGPDQIPNYSDSAKQTFSTVRGPEKNMFADRGPRTTHADRPLILRLSTSIA